MKKCECDSEAILPDGMACEYDKKKELPFVNHKPNECKCKNELKQYLRYGKRIWLCSNCVMIGDTEVK